jgi:hypothetical protein
MRILEHYDKIESYFKLKIFGPDKTYKVTGQVPVMKRNYVTWKLK